MSGWRVQVSYRAQEGTHVMTLDVANPHREVALVLALDRNVRWRGPPSNIQLAELAAEDVAGYRPNEVRHVRSSLVRS